MNEAEIRGLPKVLLHDHLDGGVRASTLHDLGARPTARGPARGGLGAYLTYFEPVLDVLQTTEALERVAQEAGEDLLAENVIYAEIRFAPQLHTRGGMTPEEAVCSVSRGLRASGLRYGLIVAAMRTDGPDTTLAAAEMAVRAGRHGVVGFDLAGMETGHPASRHQRALDIAGKGGLGVTVHAGEAAGAASVDDALRSGAVRIGHGVRATEAASTCHELAARKITLEICPSSNLDTGIYRTVGEHPVERLRAAGIAVTINTDNRSASATSLSRELLLCAEEFRWTAETILELQRNAIRAAFLPESEKNELFRLLNR